MDNKCSICLEKLDNNDVFETNCNHKFHKNCIKMWITSKNRLLDCYKCHLLRMCFDKNKICKIKYSCPFCRQNNFIDLQKKNYLLNLKQLQKRFEFNIRNNLSHDISVVGANYFI